MKPRQKLLAAVVPVAMLSLFGASSVQAQASCPVPNATFGLALNISGICSGTLSASTALTFFDKMSTDGIQSFSTVAYTGTQAATIFGSFNSLAMTMAFPTANSNTLTLNIPGLGYSATFTGATRDISAELLADHLETENNLLGRILRYQAANSPTSPISGPGGLIQTVAASDFNSNFTDTATNIAVPASVAAAAVSSSKTTPNLIGVSLQYGAMDVGFSKVRVMTVPLSYTIRNNIDPRRQLTFNLPITVVDADGAKSYQAGFGTSYRFPMNDNWTLTPAGKYSAVGSIDMATVSSLLSLSLTSTYIWNMDGYDIAMGNMIGYSKTGKFKFGDYDFDPGISNTVLRNGLMLSQPVVLAGTKLSVEYALIDTRYRGSAMYANNTQEIGITLGTNKSAFSARSFLRSGISYIRGRDTKGFNFNLGYWF